MSQLIKKLRQVSESISPSLGFKTSSASSIQPMLLVSVITKETDSANIDAILDAGVDAVLLHTNNLMDGLRPSFKTPDNIPWGIWADMVSADDLNKLADTSCDFLTFVSSKAPAALLEEETGKVLHLSMPIDDSLMVTINQMAIDAVLIDYSSEEDVISVSHLIDCQRISRVIRKPLLVVINQDIGDKELLALWEAGANGIVVKNGSQSEIQRLQKAIAIFPKNRSKSAERRPILPPSD